jgi:hypothetical protein
MAEVKNSFLKSKMNQDLDDRLIPNGEYRYAKNISVGKSEADDIGALENVLGNELLALTETTMTEGMVCIGAFMDNQNNRIFQFLTDYNDPNPSSITLPESGNMKIVMYNFNSPESYVTLVEGLFLNFAKNNEFRVIGVNLIEGLLFWTDNRNQPRKININNAIGDPNYYATEEQISVAKYAPVDSILLYRKVNATVTNVISGTEFTVNSATNIVPGMTVLSQTISGADYAVVTSVSGSTVKLYDSATITNGDKLTFLISTMSDKSSIPSWPGDPDFLEDRYVRFSYRFKYDDNEYSLMAPFTQIAYIPKQKGYFIAGNEIDAYRSTIINWFENYINNIDLVVPLPDKVKDVANSYKITEIDILYKESDSLAIKVFETIPISSINTPANAENNYYIQPYQSQKPYKTLPEDQTIRVYDKVPVRARAQETAGNRVIYGNFYDKYTPVSSINYNVSVQPKTTNGTNFIEYPNHTLKKNRNYQVGFILADKFGRQSPVVLSSADLPGLSLGDNEYAKGSTVYSSYENSILFQDVKTWFGDSLFVYVNSPISQDKDISSGKPGLYAIPTSPNGFAITASAITDSTYTFTLDTTASSNTKPEIGNIMRGAFKDYVEVLNIQPTGTANQWRVTTNGRVNNIYNYTAQQGGVKDIKFAYDYNPIGWYSYKIVVRQQEQDYYNVYLPGMLNGYPKNQTYGSQVVYNSTGVASLETGVNTTQFPVSETNNTSHIVLINDNINKVPRDLSEVGPDQKQYRSSVQLYGRVENTKAEIEIIGEPSAYSAKVTEIYYDSTDPVNSDWIFIKPGDGIQCLEADTPTPLPGGGTVPNQYRWLGDTVVVSNDVDNVGLGTITISSPNWVLGPTNPYITFRIIRAENKQYFPTRKADTVISIATANEFNFLDNSTDNISGTAGLNFYQLQTRPLIGRVSTVNEIGVVASDMIPFLSVYETRPTESLLELFWETATTGLISDLNADVLTGYDGPSGFIGVDYTHFENQNPNGTSSVTGAENSKYITDEFYVLNQNGIILNDTTVTLLDVRDAVPSSPSRLNNFGLETITGGSATGYRLYIKSPFVFNNNAPSAESYTFTFNVIDNNDPSTATTLNLNGRLSNNAPIITTSNVNYNITQNSSNFVTLQANNGSFNDSITGLKWSIIDGDTVPPSFSINEYTGQLSLINSQIPLGIYELEIKVQDAVNTSTGQILLPEGNNFGTKNDTIVLNVNVGDEPVPYWLRPTYTSTQFLTPGTTCSPTYIPSQALYPNFARKFGIVYIGPEKNVRSLPPTYQNSYLPVIPGSNGYYQFSENVEVVNASPVEIVPTGLTHGECRIKVSLIVPVPDLCNEGIGFASIASRFKIYLYKRIYNPTTPSVWQLTETANNKQTEYELNVVQNSSFSLIPEKILTTSFTIEADETNLNEYAIGIEMNSNISNTSGASPNVTVYCEDANYSYNPSDYNTPITTPYVYYTGLENIVGYTSAPVYQTQDAIRGVSYGSNTNPINTIDFTSGSLEADAELVNANFELAPGMQAQIYNSSGALITFGNITQINVANNPKRIKIQLYAPWPTTQQLLGGNIVFTTPLSSDDTGALYANTEEGTEIKRLYTDSNFTQKWIPPVADRFYVLRTDKNYDPDDTGIYTDYPFFCVKVDGDGKVVEQISPAPDSQTAWATPANQVKQNYSYNVYYSEPSI